MPDAWILVFLARGMIAAAGDHMPLDQCMQQAHDMPSSNTHIACINVQDPSCRVYLKDVPLTVDVSKRCTLRAGKRKESV